MGKALDLAMSICSGSLHTDNIVHDWNTPLVVGSPTTGEIAVFSWNPILHRVEIEAASASTGDTISILSFDSLGAILINEQPLASQADLAAAVEAAAQAASDAAQSATTAQTAVGQVNDSILEIAGMIDQFNVDYEAARDLIQQQVALAQQAAADALGSSQAASTQVGLAQSAAGSAQTAAAESTARASANAGVTFSDGSKSAAVYADLSRQNSQVTRQVATRALLAAGFPETFQPGFLAKRARVTGGGARVVTVPQGIWPLGDGEAWASYRLEAAGSVQIIKQAGNTTGEIIPTLASHMIGRARYGTLVPSTTLSRVVAVPAVVSGKLVVIAAVSWASLVTVAMSCSFDNGLTSVVRQSPRTTPLANQNAHFGIFEANLANFPGADVTFNVVAGPDANFQAVAAFVVTNNGTATPIQSRGETATSGSATNCTLTAVPASSIVLALSVQRGLGSFASFSNNLNVLASGNMLAVPTAGDTDVVKNAAWGYGVGVAATAGDVVIQANYANAAGGPGISAISYPPGTGAIQPLVTMIYEGGRDTLDVVGAEAVLNFVPDGRTVYVNIPKNT